MPKTPLLVQGFAYEVPQFSWETEEARLFRLAGVKLDKGTLQMGKPPET